MRRKKIKVNRKKIKSQEGQGLVEFAIILPILLLLFLVPMDLFRIINTKMILSTAASESIAKLNHDELADGDLEGQVLYIVESDFEDKLDINKVVISHLARKNPEDGEYTYYVYSSDLAEENPNDFQNQFENRDSNYRYTEIELQISYNIEPITFWGGLFIGESFDVKTPLYKKNVYISGYSELDP